MFPSPIRSSSDWSGQFGVVSGPVAVLDRHGSGAQAIGFQKLLQRIPHSPVLKGQTPIDRIAQRRSRNLQIIWLAETLSRLIPNANCLHEHEFARHRSIISGGYHDDAVRPPKSTEK